MSALRRKTARMSMPVYDEDCLSDGEFLRLEKIADPVDRENYLCGAMGQRRPAFDCPEYSLNRGREMVLGGPDQAAGNAWIVFGLDRNSFAGSGFGGKNASHCAAIDIVVGRGASYAAAKEADGSPIIVGPMFNGETSDAARIYLSQRAGVDQYFNLPAKSFPNTPPWEFRSSFRVTNLIFSLAMKRSVSALIATVDRGSLAVTFPTFPAGKLKY